MHRIPSSLRGRLDTNNLRTSETNIMNQSMINFGKMHIILRMATMLSLMVHKGRRWRLNIKVKEIPFAEGSSDCKFYKP
jgi:uncharacterized membrane protein affecting hemolysin expression